MKWLTETVLSNTAKRMMGAFSVYTCLNFLNQAIPFLLIPLLTRLLNVEDYGLLSTFTAMAGIANILISMGTTDAVARAYFDRLDTKFDFSRYVANALIINVCAFIIFAALVPSARSFFGTRSSLSLGWLYLLPVIGFATSVYNVPSKLFVFKKQPFAYASLELSNTTVEILLSILLVLAGLGWKGRVLGITVAQVLFCAIALRILFKTCLKDIRFDAAYAKNILSYGVPVVIHSLGFAAITAIDRFFLNTYSGLAATGIYSVAYSFASMIGFLISAFSLAWSPFFYERLGSATASIKVRLVKATYLFFGFMIALGAVFALVVPHVLRFVVGEKFWAASGYIGWLAMAYAMHGMYTIVAPYIFYAKKTYVLVLIALIAIGLSIVLDSILIPAFGIDGAVRAVFMVFFAKFALFWYFGNRVHPMPWFSFAKKDAVV